MKSGFIAVIGRANAGKSTLVNVLVGEKVAIVSPKPQTTRNSIMGVLTKENYQLVFVDTPGLYKSGNKLTDIMMKSTEDASEDVDFILYVHDGHGGITDTDITLMKKYACGKIPAAGGDERGANHGGLRNHAAGHHAGGALHPRFPFPFYAG